MSNKKNYNSFFKSCVKFSLSAAFVFYGQLALAEIDLKPYKNDLEKIEIYLNNITTLSANFTQTSEGSVANGIFLLSRGQNSAGKMRIEYENDPKILVVVNGSVLSYVDVELDEVSRLSTNTTPASLLTRPHISFSSKDVEIKNIEKNSDEIKVSLLKKNRKEAGEFSLIFNLNPVEFRKMEVKNELNQTILVTLSNLKLGTKLANSLFIIKDKNLD
jgi:outer membrane lipoprotein-sorting protein